MSASEIFSDESRRAHAEILTRVVSERRPGALDISGCPAPLDLCELALRFALLPRLVARTDLVPLAPELRTKFEAWRVDYEERAAARAAEAFVLSSLLRSEGIEHVFLKGAGLAAHGVAAVAGDRHTDDIDLLVPSERREDVLRLIADVGYAPDHDSALPAVGGGTIADQEFTTSTHSELGLVSPRGVRLDLHWRVPDAAVGRFEDVLEHTVLAGPSGGAIPVPSPPMLLAQICDHVVVHHRARPAYLPRHTADLVDLVARFGEDLWRQAEGLGDPLALRMSRWLAERAIDGRLPALLLFPPRPMQAGLEAAAELIDVVDRVRRDLREDPRRIARKVVPSREFVASSYGIAPDDPRIPLCYVHRLVTLRFLFKPLRG